MSFVVRGLFRVYYADADEQEHTLAFIKENEFLASLKSMITQEACPFYIGALEDSALLSISNEHLQQLYAASHGWEHFGRLLAEQSSFSTRAAPRHCCFNRPSSATWPYSSSFQALPTGCRWDISPHIWVFRGRR